MTQSWTADESLQAPGWPANVATTFVDTTFKQRFRRANPWQVATTLLGTGASTGPSLVGTAGGLGYLAMAPDTSVLGMQWSARRDGLQGQTTASMLWLDNRDDLYSQDDLDLTWVFALQTQGGGGYVPSGGTGTGLPPYTVSTGGLGRGVIPSRMTGAPGIGQTGILSNPIKQPIRVLKPNNPEAGAAATGWRGWFVGFRVQGGYVTNTAAPGDYDTARYSGVDGYWVWVRPQTGGAQGYSDDADLEVRFYSTLGTAAATGARRMLASTTIPNGVSFLNLKAPVKIRVECQNNGSTDPEIKIFMGPWDGGGEQQLFAANLPGTVTQSLSASGVTVDSEGTITDAQAAYQLTGQGTVAFGGYPDRVDTFGDTGPNDISVTEGLVRYEHKKLTTGSVLIRDEFKRVGLNAIEPGSVSLTLGIKNRFGIETPSLECDWMWGNNSNTAHYTGELDRRLDGNAAGGTSYTPTAFLTVAPEEGVPPGVSTTDNRTDVVSFRPADSPTSQHRRITFTPGQGDPTNGNYSGHGHYFGLTLLGTLSQGYLASCMVGEIFLVADATGAQTSVVARIGRRTAQDFGASPISTYQDVLTQVLASPPDLLDGAAHTLEFDCHNFSAGSGVGAPKIYVLKLDGTAVTWVDADVAPGKTVTVLTDSALDLSPPVSKGSIEGFYFYGGAQTDTGGVKLWDPWTVHTWEQLALTEAEGISPDEMLSIPLASEGAASGQDLHTVLTEDFTIIEETYLQSSIHQFDSGHHAGYSHWSKERRTYRMGSRALTNTQAVALRAFWDDHTGITTPFTWTQDGEAALTVAFVDGTLLLEEIAPSVFRAEFELREVFV